MPQSAPYITGRYDARLDRGWRLTVPAGWRAGVNDLLFLLPRERHGQPFLEALPEAEFLDRLWRIDRARRSDESDRSNLRAALAGCCRCLGLGQRGQLTVPRTLGPAAGLRPGTPVALLGRGTWFEVWADALYQVVAGEDDRLLARLAVELGVF